MKNGLYLTQADSVSFSQWFAEVYKQTHPDSNITECSCKNITIVVTEDCNFNVYDAA